MSYLQKVKVSIIVIISQNAVSTYDINTAMVHHTPC